MPSEVSRSNPGVGDDAPYVPSWCFDPPGPRNCICGHHEGYHNDAGRCLQIARCGCAGFDPAPTLPKQAPLENIPPPVRSEPGVEVAWATIPGHLKRGIVRWVDEGIRPGSFLCAVIANDLFRAVGLADPESFAALRLICQFFYNYMPMGCQGSELRMKEWAEQRASTRHPLDISG